MISDLRQLVYLRLLLLQSSLPPALRLRVVSLAAIAVAPGVPRSTKHAAYKAIIG